MASRLWSVAAMAAVLALGVGATLASGEHEGHGGKAKAEEKSAKGKGARQRVLFAVLRGRNELAGDPLRKGAGDPDGRGAASVTIDGNNLCFGLTVTNIATPVAAHIHAGRRNQNGPIVVDFTPPVPGDPGSSSGCVTDDDAPAIQRRPKRYYVNVHTADLPGGAVRGQLFGKRR